MTSRFSRSGTRAGGMLGDPELCRNRLGTRTFAGLTATSHDERPMVWRVSKIDPATNVAAEAVLNAFESARRSGRPSVECYRAGVEAWRREHPDQSAEYAAKQAVAVILATYAKIRIEE
jgi:hypothetical protein